MQCNAFHIIIANHELITEEDFGSVWLENTGMWEGQM